MTTHPILRIKIKAGNLMHSNHIFWALFFFIAGYPFVYAMFWLLSGAIANIFDLN